MAIAGRSEDKNKLTGTLKCSTLQNISLSRIYMQGRSHLGELEQIVLLAVIRLGDGAYGVPIRRAIENRTRRQITVGALYRTLDRLEDKGYLTSWFGDPTPERGGRSKRYFKVEALALKALRESRSALDAMWEGLEHVRG
jgi:DNA-binding PadR family transcriptional regulator